MFFVCFVFHCTLCCSRCVCKQNLISTVSGVPTYRSKMHSFSVCSCNNVIMPLLMSVGHCSHVWITSMAVLLLLPTINNTQVPQLLIWVIGLAIGSLFWKLKVSYIELTQIIPINATEITNTTIIVMINVDSDRVANN